MPTKKTKKRQSSATRKLSPREQLFVLLYLGECRLNGAKAARMAGYSDAKNEAYRLLHREPVRAAIDKGLQGAAVPPDELKYHLARIARGSLAPFLFATETDDLPDLDLQVADGNITKDKIKEKARDRVKHKYTDSWGDDDPLHDDQTPTEDITFRLFSRQARANLDLIKKLKVRKRTIEGEKGSSTTVEVEIETYSRLQAIQMLMRAEGMFKADADATQQWIASYLDKHMDKLSMEQLDALARGENELEVLLSGLNQHEVPETLPQNVPESLPDENGDSQDAPNP